MAVCKKIRKINRQVCIGGMNKRIEIQARAITPPDFDVTTDYDEEFTEVRTVWSNVVTVTGVQLFDGTGIVRNITHFFYIRYFPNVTFENWILFDSEYYDIIDVEDLDHDKRFYRIRASKRGISTNDANLA